MTDTVTADTLAAAITTAFTSQHATRTVKIPFEDLKIQQFTLISPYKHPYYTVFKAPSIGAIKTGVHYGGH